MNGAELLLIFPGLALLFGARMVWRQNRYHGALSRASLYQLPTMDDVISKGLVGTFKHDAAAQQIADVAVSAGTNVEVQRLKKEYDAALREAYVALPGSFIAAVAASLILPRVPPVAGVDVDAARVIWTAFALVVGGVGIGSAIRWARRGRFALAAAFVLGVVGLVVAYGWIMSEL